MQFQIRESRTFAGALSRTLHLENLVKVRRLCGREHTENLKKQTDLIDLNILNSKILGMILSPRHLAETLQSLEI